MLIKCITASLIHVYFSILEFKVIGVNPQVWQAEIHRYVYMLNSQSFNDPLDFPPVEISWLF